MASSTAVAGHLSPDPYCIGKGSFASVWVVAGTLVAFKVAHLDTDRNEIEREFHTCDTLYSTCNHSSFFATPRALAFFAPPRDDSSYVFRSSASAPVCNQPVVNRHLRRPIIVPEQFQSFDNATYVLDLVPSLPEHAAQRLRAAYFPPNSPTFGPNLCRLYFGKEIDESAPGRFVNTHNFPVYASRYRALRESHSDFLESAETVAHGMGDMLGRIHTSGGYDGRDIEFVLGGDSGGGFSFYVIDFNQMRPWDGNGIQPLVDAFFVNDPYYPRPRPSDPLYTAFQVGYRGAYYRPGHRKAPLEVGDAFLHAIEVEQAARDARSSE